MKKLIFTFLVIITLCITLCSCGNGNRSVVMTDVTYNTVHVHSGEYTKDFTVEKWSSKSYTGIEVLTKEAGTIYLSEGTYILFENECELCK